MTTLRTSSGKTERHPSCGGLRSRGLRRGTALESARSEWLGYPVGVTGFRRLHTDQPRAAHTHPRVQDDDTLGRHDGPIPTRGARSSRALAVDAPARARSNTSHHLKWASLIYGTPPPLPAPPSRPPVAGEPKFVVTRRGNASLPRALTIALLFPSSIRRRRKVLTETGAVEIIEADRADDPAAHPTILERVEGKVLAVDLSLWIFHAVSQPELADLFPPRAKSRKWCSSARSTGSATDACPSASSTASPRPRNSPRCACATRAQSAPGGRVSQTRRRRRVRPPRHGPPNLRSPRRGGGDVRRPKRRGRGRRMRHVGRRRDVIRRDESVQATQTVGGAAGVVAGRTVRRGVGGRDARGGRGRPRRARRPRAPRGRGLRPGGCRPRGFDAGDARRQGLTRSDRARRREPRRGDGGDLSRTGTRPRVGDGDDLPRSLPERLDAFLALPNDPELDALDKCTGCARCKHDGGGASRKTTCRRGCASCGTDVGCVARDGPCECPFHARADERWMNKVRRRARETKGYAGRFQRAARAYASETARAAAALPPARTRVAGSGGGDDPTSPRSPIF